MDESEWLADRFEEHRAHLRAVAYRMPGSLTEADDAVQDAWLRVSRAEAGEVGNLGGWLTTIVARVCLNMLRARNRPTRGALRRPPGQRRAGVPSRPTCGRGRPRRHRPRRGPGCPRRRGRRRSSTPPPSRSGCRAAWSDGAGPAALRATGRGRRSPRRPNQRRRAELVEIHVADLPTRHSPTSTR